VLALNPRATLKTLLDERMPLYLEVAGRVVPTSGRSIVEVVEDVVRDLRGH
jgi:shikimate kinase